MQRTTHKMVAPLDLEACVEWRADVCPGRLWRLWGVLLAVWAGLLFTAMAASRAADGGTPSGSAAALQGDTRPATEDRAVGDSRPLDVAEFGAVADDGQCDTLAIEAAIRAALRLKRTEIRFAAGTYNLTRTVSGGMTGKDSYLCLRAAENLTLSGATDEAGRPLTRLERKVVLDNDAMPPNQVSIQQSRNITLRNFVLANHPPLGTTARAIAVDKARDEVVVEVLEGLPAYDGMRCASAHAWDLATGRLKRFGRTPKEATLTIGTNIQTYWKAVPGTGARQLRMCGAGFAAKLAVGDGVSWHHKASESHNQTAVMDSRDVVFENIRLPNVSNMGMLAGYNHNLTFRKVRFEPERGNLAIGGRDGLHLSMTSGRLLVEDCYFKGLRMDPLVIRRSFGLVKEIHTDGALRIAPGYAVARGGRIRFWIGAEPADRAVEASERQKGGYVYRFRGGAPAGVKVGDVVSYLTHSLDEGLIRNTVFADNFGSAIVNFEENLTVEGCTFDNNAYQVKYGPNAESGGFVRNNVIRGNTFLNTSWVDIAHRGQPASIVIHSLSKFFQSPRYNRNILITGNVFRNPYGDATAAAVDVRNAEDVRIVDNVFEGFLKPVLIDGQPLQ
mgnify:FL=1